MKVTDTNAFIQRSDIPQVQDIKYSNFVCDYIALKYEPYQIRLVV